MINKKVKDVVFSIFDTETTGNNKNRVDRPIEIAAVKWGLDSGFFGVPKSWLVDPEMLIHPSAIAVHGLLDEDVVGKPKLNEVMPEVLDYIGDSILVAHNIDFDLSMLPELREKPNLKIDTLKFAKKIYKLGDLNKKGHDLTSYKSQELRYWLDIKIDTMGLQAHRAAADILVTGEVFKAMVVEFLAMNPESTIGEMIEYIDAPNLIEKMTFGKYLNVPISEAVDIELKKGSKNYFSWMWGEMDIGKMKIDNDLKYSIEFFLKKAGVDPNAWLVKENIKSWAELSNASSPQQKLKM